VGHGHLGAGTGRGAGGGGGASSEEGAARQEEEEEECGGRKWEERGDRFVQIGLAAAASTEPSAQ